MLDAPAAAVAADRIAAMRQFNRFYTAFVGALDHRQLRSDFSLPELRILYEIAGAADRGGITAAELARRLAMDPGYLSRLLAGLARQGLIERLPAPGDARRRRLALTAPGRTVFAGLDAAAARDVALRLGHLSAAQQVTLLRAMAQIRHLLGDRESPRTLLLRDPEPGDLGWIIHRQAVLYAEEYGWDATFEALLTEIVAGFVKHFDPACERCWVAEGEAQILGAVFVVRDDATTARLRMLYVEPAARGQGLGRRLVETSIAFARAKGYRQMTLWTNDVLTAARRIYEATGFTLVRSEPHRSFGQELMGQIWQRPL